MIRVNRIAFSEEIRTFRAGELRRKSLTLVRDSLQISRPGRVLQCRRSGRGPPHAQPGRMTCKADQVAGLGHKSPLACAGKGRGDDFAFANQLRGESCGATTFRCGACPRSRSVCISLCPANFCHPPFGEARTSTRSSRSPISGPCCVKDSAWDYRSAAPSSRPWTDPPAWPASPGMATGSGSRCRWRRARNE